MSINQKIFDLKERKRTPIDKISQVLDLKINASIQEERRILDAKYIILSDDLKEVNDRLNQLSGIDISETKVQSRFDLTRDGIKKFEDGEFKVSGELLHSFVNKILVVDAENIIYLVPRNKIYNHDEIRKDRKKFAKYILFLENQFINKCRNKKYILNYRVVLIQPISS